MYIAKIGRTQRRNTDKSIIIVGDFNTNFFLIDKTSKDIENFKNVINTFDLMEIYKTLHLITAEYLPLKTFQEHIEHFQKLVMY